MYKLNELCKKLNILPSEELIEQLKSIGYKLENGLISGTGTIDGQNLNAEDGLTLLISKAGMALAKKEDGNISSPQPATAPQYQVQNSFDFSVQETIQTGQEQMTAAARSGYALGEEMARVRTAASLQAYFKETSAQQRQNIDLLFAVDRAIVTGANVDVSNIARELKEGKYRPSLP